MSVAVDQKTSRRHVEHVSSQHRVTEAKPSEPGRVQETLEFRIDLERLRFSSYFARLSDVTQVVPRSGIGPVMHNRLTHSLKVSAVARVIAANLAEREANHREFLAGKRAERDETGALVAKLGGCDSIVAQAAAHAHDLGHPPFGHQGEFALDRVAREKLGLAEGFEGNAQSFRILTQLDTLGRDFPGLNLTAASRASTLKYPWTRAEWLDTRIEDLPLHERPRGVGVALAGADKFSAYALEAAEMEQALAAFPAIGKHVQTIECAVMDLADDIAYAIHDLDDFTRAGNLQQSAITDEFHSWLQWSTKLAGMSDAEIAGTARVPGHSLELLWRRIALKDSWIADREAFAAAVSRVNTEVGETLLAAPYDGGIDSDRAVSTFTRRWIDHLRTSIVIEEQPHVRSGHVRLNQQAWHEVTVLKFVHAHFVLERPELGQPQRGMAKLIEGLVLGLEEWLTDSRDAGRAPRRLLEWVDRATAATFDLHRDRPELIMGDSSVTGLRRQGRARAILDYVAAMSDQQAVTTYRELTGAESGR